MNLGVIGYGDSAKDFIKAAKYHPHWNPVCVGGRNMEKARVCADTFGIQAVPVDEMVGRDDIDAISISTPPGVHLDDALKVIEHKKHLLVEKPMALCVEDCDTMIDAAQKYKVKLMVTHTHRFYPSDMKARELIENGEIGDVIMISLFSSHNYFSEKRVGWQVDPALSGGGIIMNPVVHMVDKVRYYAGCEIDHLLASVGFHKEGYDQIEGDTNIYLKMKNGSSASIMVYGYGEARSRGNLVMGTRGTLAAESFGTRVFIKKDGQEREIQGETLKKNPMDPVNAGYLNHLEYVLQAIEKNVPVKSDGENGRANVKACLAVLESARTGKVIRL